MGTCTLTGASGPEAPRGTALRTERGLPSHCPHVTQEWGLQPLHRRGVEPLPNRRTWHSSLGPRRARGESEGGGKHGVLE